MADDPRVHPYFAAELRRLLQSMPSDVELAEHPGANLDATQRSCDWIAHQLADLGWKIEPSRQRRMQLDPPQPPPAPMQRQHFTTPPEEIRRLAADVLRQGPPVDPTP